MKKSCTLQEIAKEIDDLSIQFISSGKKIYLLRWIDKSKMPEEISAKDLILMPLPSWALFYLLVKLDLLTDDQWQNVCHQLDKEIKNGMYELHDIIEAHAENIDYASNQCLATNSWNEIAYERVGQLFFNYKAIKKIYEEYQLLHHNIVIEENSKDVTMRIYLLEKLTTLVSVMSDAVLHAIMSYWEIFWSESRKFITKMILVKSD